MTELLLIALVTLSGTLAGCILACVPSLHVYSILGLATAGIHWLNAGASPVPHDLIIALMGGAITGWSVTNTIPSVLLAAPDESAVLTVLPGQTYAMEGRGFEAVMITATGSLLALLLMVACMAPIAPAVLPALQSVFRNHTHWILWTVIAFLLMSEWPKLGTQGQGGWRRFFDGWITTGAGLLTFLLAGILGFIIRYRSPVSTDMAFQNLMPALVGLFALPWLILNVASRTELPAQSFTPAVRVDPRLILRGTLAGTLGGAFAAFFPGITGGIGGLLAGHATAQRDSRVFMVSQGASKAVYYVGAFAIFFVPGIDLTRGTGAWLVRQFYEPTSWRDYYVVLGVICIAAAAAFVLTAPLARVTLRLAERTGYRSISIASAAVSVLLVLASTGLAGLAVMTVATGIGLIPVLFHSRRLNCLGVILLPMACGMSGFGDDVARFMGLL